MRKGDSGPVRRARRTGCARPREDTIFTDRRRPQGTRPPYGQGAAATRRVAGAAGELAAWWVTLTALWLVLIQTVGPLECVVGAAAALLAACAARAARRTVTGGAR